MLKLVTNTRMKKVILSFFGGSSASIIFQISIPNYVQHNLSHWLRPIESTKCSFRSFLSSGEEGKGGGGLRGLRRDVCALLLEIFCYV